MFAVQTSNHDFANPPPEYPKIAKGARAAGVVLVLVVVDEEGRVMAAQAVAGHPLLREVALKVARGARFTPTPFDGKPVKGVGRHQLRFHPAMMMMVAFDHAPAAESSRKK